MLVRAVGGVVLCLVGVLWIAQGSGAMSGSSMSGKGGTPRSEWWWR
jgi:hypothetical protein